MLIETSNRKVLKNKMASPLSLITLSLSPYQNIVSLQFSHTFLKTTTSVGFCVSVDVFHNLLILNDPSLLS